MFLHFFFVFLFFLASLFSSEIGLSIILSAHAIAMIIDRMFIRKLSIDPLVCYGIYSFLVGIANIEMIQNVHNGSVPFAYAYIIPEHINVSVQLFYLGNAFIFIGYELFSKRSFFHIDVDIDEKYHVILFRIMLLLSIRRLLFHDAFFGALTNILTVFSSVGIVFFARLWGRFDDKRYRNYAITLFLLQTVFAFMYSYLRSEILLPTVSIFIGYFLGKNSIRAMFSYRVLPFVVLGLLFNSFFAFYGAARTDLDKGFVRFTQIQRIAEMNDVYEEGENEKGESVLYRASVLPQVTNVVELVKSRGYFDGDAMAPLLIALVPRILWPDKPLIGLGAWFATEIGQGLQTDSWYTNSINMTIQGHLFLDFGWVGMAIGCILVGGLLASLWNATQFYKSPYNITGITLGGYLLLTGLQGIGADLQIIITFISYYGIFFFIRRVVK